MRFLLHLFVFTLAAQSFEISVPPEYTKRLTISRKPISVLRAITSDTAPESAGLYSVRVCSLVDARIVVSAGEIEQAIEAQKIAVVKSIYSESAISRSRFRGRPQIKRAGEIATTSGTALGLAKAAGVENIHAAVPILLAGAGIVVALITDNASNEQYIFGDIKDWLPSEGLFTVNSKDCTPRFSVLGSYRKSDPITHTVFLR